MFSTWSSLCVSFCLKEIIDDRPEIIRQLEEYTTGKWKRLADDEYVGTKVESKQMENNDGGCVDRDQDGDMDFIRRKRTSKDNRKGGEKCSRGKLKKNKMKFDS